MKARKRVVVIVIGLMVVMYLAAGVLCSLTARPALYVPMWAAVLWAIRNLVVKGRAYCRTADDQERRGRC